MPEIRCANKCYGEVTENSTGEFRKICESRFCGKSSEVIVEHIWNLGKISEDGIIRPIETKRYKRPEVRGIVK